MLLRSVLLHVLLLKACKLASLSRPVIRFVQESCEGVVVTPLGLEPRTCGLKVRCSAN